MTNGSSAARQDLRRRRGLSKLEQGYMGFILILPWLIGFCIFKLYPFVSSLVYSFTDYDLFKGVQNVVGSRTTSTRLPSLRTSRRCK